MHSHYSGIRLTHPVRSTPCPPQAAGISAMELPGPRRSVRCIKRKRFDDFETDEESVLAPNYPLEARQHLPLMRLLWVAELANAGIPLGNTCAQSDREAKRQ